MSTNIPHSSLSLSLFVWLSEYLSVSLFSQVKVPKLSADGQCSAVAEVKVENGMLNPGVCVCVCISAVSEG